MIFKPKSKGIFVDRNENSWLLARTSSGSAPCTVDRLLEVALDDAEALAAALADLQGGKGGSNPVPAVCGVYPARRLIRRVSLEAKRMKEPAYLNEVCIQQFRIEPDKHTLVVLNPANGQSLDPSRLTDKEVLIAGVSSEDINECQDAMLSSGLYPDRLELGSLSTLGGVLSYLQSNKVKSPTLVLEMGNEGTHSFILGAAGVEASRPIPFGIESMVPVVQKKLGLKDEESARKLFYSNTFDFTSMGAELVQRLLKELQSSIGFFEVQTGQSISQLVCTSLPPKLGWIEQSIATSLGIACMRLDLAPWLQSLSIVLADQARSVELDSRWIGLFSLMLSHQNSVSHAAADQKA